MTSPAAQFEAILRNETVLPDRQLSGHEVGLLSHYYQMVLKWNARLHLTTITKPAEFVERHIGESAFAASMLLKTVEQVWDLGTGLGVPGLPIAILRPELSVILVEASRNKAVFLEEVIAALSLSNVRVMNQRIESIPSLPSAACSTMRAVERMEKLIPLMLQVGGSAAQLLIFGNADTEQIIRQSAADSKMIFSYLIPHSDNRFLIELRST